MTMVRTHRLGAQIPARSGMWGRFRRYTGFSSLALAIACSSSQNNNPSEPPASTTTDASNGETPTGVSPGGTGGVNPNPGPSSTNQPGPGSNVSPGPDGSSTNSTSSGTTGGTAPMPTNGSPTDTSDGPVAPGPDDEPLDYPEPVDVPDEDGSKLWLRYPVVPVQSRLDEYKAAFTNVVKSGDSPTLNAAAEELVLGLSGLTGTSVPAGAAKGSGDVVIGTVGTPDVDAFGVNAEVTPLGRDGYVVKAVQMDGAWKTVVAGNTDVGVLYGAFALLRQLSMHVPVAKLSLEDSPKIQHRMLNHWDDLNGAVERGYAGRSIWNWNALPGTVSPRYKEYARANASIGINGTVITNVNATKGNNEDMWGAQRAQYFAKVKALADVFRPYGIRVYLTAPFTAGGTANPADANTRRWWVDSINELYELIPDFGGLLIKASSEGEPGPSNGATHADGANMLAEAVGDRGIVLWRAFVYGENVAADRIRQAYDEFKPLDGKFNDNVLVQVKNGPLDFQPREPFSPLFGKMPQTPLALELQITKEYLGQDTHLAYVGPWYEEILQSDTYASGEGSSVARVIDGTVHDSKVTAIAGVSNVGNDTNWTGSHFNQANWYAYGRMAWDPDASAHEIAREWIRQTLTVDPEFVEPVSEIMMQSYPALVNYMTPLGLVHIMGTDHHYGPAPWVNDLGRAEWNPFYYHSADAQAIGFNRTSSSGGSNAIEQYHEPLKTQYSSPDTTSNDLLLFFHRVSWDRQLDTGRTVWEELVHRYSQGVDDVQVMRDKWAAAAPGRIDAKRLKEMTDFLQIQHWEARWWRDACLAYFGSRSGKSIPAGYAPTLNNLAFYQGLTCPSNRDKPTCPQVYNVEASPTILE